MATQYDLIYLGNFADLDPVEGFTIVSENQFDLNGRTFNPISIVTLTAADAGLTYVFDNGEQGGFQFNPQQPISYNLGSGTVTTLQDGTIGAVDMTITLGDGSSVIRRGAFVQMENGDLFVGDSGLDGTMSGLNIRSMRVDVVLATAEDRFYFYQGVTNTTVVGANTAPFFTNVSNGQTISIPENSTFVVDANAFDGNGDPLSYSIVGGADAGAFTIDPATGVLSFRNPVDFEGARSAVGNDQVYDVTIRVADGRGGQQDVALLVNVTDVPEGGVVGDGTVNGTGGPDIMRPGFVDAQGDIIDGADGLNDTILGGDGLDSIEGGLGNDSINGGNNIGGVRPSSVLQPFEEIYGGAGNDTIIFGAEDAVYGGADADFISYDRAQLDSAGVNTGTSKVFAGSDGVDNDTLDLRNAGNWRFQAGFKFADTDGNGFTGQIELLDANGNFNGQYL